MSFEPDTNDIRVRQLGEEIKKIREEQFAKSFPIGLGGGSSPVGGDSVTGGSSTGTFAWLPNMVRVTRDTGVVERLAYKDKNVNKDFFIGDIVDGVTSGASGEIGDIDITGTDTGFLIFVPGTTSGTFVDDEFLNATTDGNNIAKADLSLGNPVGRGHLNAGSASIIAEAISSPAEIHFIDTALQNGQLALMRAQNGQTIRIRRAVTNDGNTGNLDLDFSFDITENALVLFQFQAQSNVTPDGGWVPLITNVSTAVSGGGSGGTTFPILYPQTNIGSVGLQTVALDLNNSNGHYQLMTLTGDISLTFVNETSVGEGFKFYAVLAQDAVGGHALISVPSSVKNGSTLVTQLDQTALSQTLFQFTTADGGTTYHAQVVSPSSSGQNQTPWLSDINADSFDLFNADKIKFLGAGGFSFPTDATLQAISTSGTALQFNVPSFQTYRFFIFGEETFQIGDPNTGTHDFFFFDNNLKDVSSISFTDSGSFGATILSIPGLSELEYITSGIGSHHSFFANNLGGNASFEIREFSNKSNVNFDLVTNNMINTDQILFIDSQGFNNATDHGERRLTGGALGINMNLPVESPFPSAFAIWFEDDALTKSDAIYQFTKDALIMGTGVGDCTLAPLVTGADGYQLCRGGGLFDTGTRTSLRSSTVSSVPLTEQLLELVVGASKKVEFTNTEDGAGGVGGGMKLFTDINMQTQNIHNIDIATWEPDIGLAPGGLGNASYAIVADESGFETSLKQFVFNIPLSADRFSWRQDNDPRISMNLSFDSLGNTPRLRLEGQFFGDTSIEASQWLFTNPYSAGTAGMVDGFMRLINAGGGIADIVVGTGGNLVNLSDISGTGDLDIDNDLGTVGSQAVEIDWDVSNFHRMVLDGDVTVGMNNLPESGEWQEVTVQFRQDNTGGHNVSFLDSFENGVTPRISKGSNRYTTVKFYSYDDGFERILAFNIIGQSIEIDPFFQGICLARLSSDQQSNTAITNHIEFNTNVFSDRITVSSGAGQVAGVFSGFVGGRTYECTCYIAVENVSGNDAPASMTVQWFDRATSTFLGVPGTATDIIIPENHQQTAIAYFTPEDDGDTLEVQIISNNGNADGVLSGNGLTTTINIPASKVNIKDCGISEGEFNDQIDTDVPPSEIPPPPPPIAFSARSILYYHGENLSLTVAGLVDGATVIPITGENARISTASSPNELVNPTFKYMAGTSGRFNKVRLWIENNTLNKDIVVTIMEDDDTELSTLFTIPASSGGQFTSASQVPIRFGHRYWYRFQTVDETNSSGRIWLDFGAEIFWGFAD